MYQPFQKKNFKVRFPSSSMIESYSFGRMVINGQEYTRDIIILPTKIISNWWRKEGHALCLEDLKEVFAAKPKMLIVGTGHDGCMQVLEEVKAYCEKNKIKLVAAVTATALQLFNARAKKNDAVGVFHLTC